MRLAEKVSYREADVLLRELDQLDVVEAALAAPAIRLEKGCSKAVREQIAAYLGARGWAENVKIDPALGPALGSYHIDGVALQVQTGNIARAFYDLMKMESMFLNGRAFCAVLILPTKPASRVIGSNIANLTRLKDEIDGLFADQIKMPLLLVGFE